MPAIASVLALLRLTFWMSGFVEVHEVLSHCRKVYFACLGFMNHTRHVLELAVCSVIIGVDDIQGMLRPQYKRLNTHTSGKAIMNTMRCTLQ